MTDTATTITENTASDVAISAPLDDPGAAEGETPFRQSLREVYRKAQESGQEGDAPKEAGKKGADAEAPQKAPDEGTEGATPGKPPVEKADAPKDAKAKAPDADDKTEDKAPEKADPVPSGVPAELRQHWASMTDEAKADVLKMQKEYSDRSAEQGRVVKQAKPVLDVIADLQQEFPALRSMAPEEVARDTAALARVRQSMADNPVQTFLTMAQQYGIVPQLQAAFSKNPSDSQQTVAQMAQEIRALKADLARVSDPNAIAQQIARVLEERDNVGIVNEFAQSNENFEKIARDVELCVPVVRQREPGLAPKAVLEKAVDMALNLHPDLRAKADAAAQAPAPPDPEKTKQQLDAASMNVPGKATGKPRDVPFQEQLRAAYRRAQAAG